MKRYVSLALLLCAALQGAPAPKPKLILTIVVDQFRYDYLTRFRSEYTGGLAQLLTKGAVFTNAHYIHFPTVTAVGHSTILSGATPSASGIIANEWFDPASKKNIESIWDDNFPLLGATSKNGASPNRLKVDTLGDELKMLNRRCKVFGVSIKDRSAILPAGHMADAAYWFDAASGNFVTSTYYVAALPAWAAAYNAKRPGDRYLGRPWLAYNAQPGDKPLRTLSSTPGKAFYDDLERTPFGNELTEQFAEAVIEQEHLGEDDITDLLSVSFSSNDRIGHRTGLDAPEVHDISVQTDRVLNKLFAYLDKKIGMDRVLVVFTADHGVAPVPEVNIARKMPGGRVDPAEMNARVVKALSEKYGEGAWIWGSPKFFLQLNRDLIKQKGLNLAEVQEAAASVIRGLDGVARVYTGSDVRTGRLAGDAFDSNVRNAYNAVIAPDVYIVLQPYWIFSRKGSEDGTDHGMPYSYDTHVPVIFMGPGVKPGEYSTRIAVNDIAPTLANVLNVEIPSGSVGRILSEIF